MSRSPASNRSVLAPAAGFTVWSIAFVALYVTLSIGCRFGWDAMLLGGFSLQRMVLVGLFFLSLGAALYVVRCARHRSHVAEADGRDSHLFLERAGLLAARAALAASIVTFGPVFFLSACH